MSNSNVWHVYQLHGAPGLLYVGHTRYLKIRLGQHKRQKPWWPEVTGIQSEEFSSEDDARCREKEIWAIERPKYNRNNPFCTAEEIAAGDRRRPRPQSAEAIARRRARDRARDQTPERRKRISKYKYSARAGYGTGTPRKRWRQSGPGLF